jgi:uncharacterized membrane protein YidH (DUF202 family)
MSQTNLAVFVIVLGLLGLAFGGFDYFQVASAATSDQFGAEIDDMGTVTVAFGLGIGAIIAGLLLFITRSEK